MVENLVSETKPQTTVLRKTQFDSHTAGGSVASLVFTVCSPCTSKEEDVVNHSGKIIQTGQLRSIEMCILSCRDSWVNRKRAHSSVSHGFYSRYHECQSPMRTDAKCFCDCESPLWSSGMCHGIGSGGSEGPAHEQTVRDSQTRTSKHVNVNFATATEWNTWQQDETH